MPKTKAPTVYEDFDLGDEQVTSNECWEVDELDDASENVYPDLNLDEEQVTSNECYDVEDE